MKIGDTVFVRWYGKILEGMIVENGEVNPMLASMVVVRVPVQGVKTQALFMPHHVYPNAELAAMKEGVKLVPTEMPTETATETPSSSNKSRHSGRHNEAWKRLQEFKEANWDHERNHIKLRALNDFYDMWKECVAEKCGYREYPKHPYVPEFNDWDNGVKLPSVGETVANTIKEAKKAVSDEKMEELKSQIKKALAPAKVHKVRKPTNVTQLSFWE